MPSPRYASRGRSAHSRRRAEDEAAARKRLGRLMSGGSAIFMLGCVVLLAAFRSPDLDQTTGCPKDGPTASAHTVILIDETDKLSRDELRFARALVRTEYKWLSPGGRLTVRNIVADPDLAGDFTICRISDGSDVMGLVKNKAKTEQDFQRIAGRKLDALLADLAVAPEQEASPILEFIARTMDRPDFGANVAARRLVVLSDFAQHSELLSHYGAGARTKLDEETRSLLVRNMSGVKARLQYVSRRELAAIQGERHKQFWTGYLNNMGAHAVIGHDLNIGEDPPRETWTDEAL